MLGGLVPLGCSTTGLLGEGGEKDQTKSYFLVLQGVGREANNPILGPI